jgi:hypothetical protein
MSNASNCKYVDVCVCLCVCVCRSREWGGGGGVKGSCAFTCACLSKYKDNFLCEDQIERQEDVRGLIIITITVFTLIAILIIIPIRKEPKICK